ERGQFLKSQLQSFAKAKHDAGAVDGGRLAPGGKRLRGGPDGAVDLVGWAVRHLRLDTASGRIEDLADAIARRRFQSTTNQERNTSRWGRGHCCSRHNSILGMQRRRSCQLRPPHDEAGSFVYESSATCDRAGRLIRYLAQPLL